MKDLWLGFPDLSSLTTSLSTRLSPSPSSAIFAPLSTSSTSPTTLARPSQQVNPPAPTAGDVRSFAAVAASPSRPMAAPPRWDTLAGGGSQPPGLPHVRPAGGSACPPVTQAGASGLHQQQQSGPAPMYAYGGQQFLMQGQGVQVLVNFGMATDGGPAPPYGAPIAGAAPHPQFQPVSVPVPHQQVAFAVGQYGVTQKRKKKKKPHNQHSHKSEVFCSRDIIIRSSR